MDSTCMGVLSMLALVGFKRKVKMRVLNAGGNRQLLKGLGRGKAVRFEDGPFSSYADVVTRNPKSSPGKICAPAAKQCLTPTRL